MIMARNDDAQGRRRPSKSHPWRMHRSTESDAPAPRTHKATMVVTAAEFHALRARAGGRSMSEFLRGCFPPELLLMPDLS